MDVVRLVVTRRTADKWGDASRGTSPTLYCPVGGGRIIKHPPHFKTPVKGTTLASAVLGMAFAGVYYIMQNGLAGVQIKGRRDRISLF